MNPTKLNQPWIPFSKIESLIQLEPALVLVALSLIGWIVYKLFLREAGFDRQKNLRLLFLNLLAHLGVFAVLYASYAIVHTDVMAGEMANRFASYLGLATLISGAIVFVKISRILLFEYLFLGHMKEGVPVLIVNLFTLLLSVGVVGWFATELFGIRLTPLLATSAIFSLVLGLALQDTLGNLFAGVALQLDKPYEIGDWIEVMQGGQKWIGRVQEITWRATMLEGLFDELLIIPNRAMSSAEIANFSAKNLPIWRSQTFRMPYSADIASAKKVLLDAVLTADGVRKNPEPLVLITEATESWLLFRCSYSIDDYGQQWRVATNVFSSVVDRLKASGHSVAAQRIQIVKEGNV